MIDSDSALRERSDRGGRRRAPSFRLAGVLGAGLLTFVGIAPPAQAEAGITCGSTLTTDTALTADLYCLAGDGLTLGPNVRLNLGGHRLIGPGTSGVGVSGTAGNTIINGEVKNWDSGIQLDSSSESSAQSTQMSHLVLRRAGVSITGSGSPVRMSRITAIDSPIRDDLGPALVISDSKLIRSRVGTFFAPVSIKRSKLVASPVSTYAQFADATIDSSVLDGRGTTRLGDLSEGVFTITNSTVRNFSQPIAGFWGSVVLVNNTFTDNRGGVVGDISYNIPGLSGSAIVRGNTFIRSGVVLNPRTEMIVERNRFYHNVQPVNFSLIQIEGEPQEHFASSKAVGNVLTRNRGTAIKTLAPGVAIGGNKATFNGDYGIDAPGAVDLGKNIAFGNRSGQCIGVVCAGK